MRPRVLIACSGLGHVARGFETATAELAACVADKVDLLLVRGGGRWWGEPGIRLPCIQRFGRAAALGGLDGPRGYLIEQRSFAPWLYALIRLGRFNVVHLHDPALMNLMWHARRRLGGRFSIVFTNSGPLEPEHLSRPDLVQCVTPVDEKILRDHGFGDDRVAMIPYGIPQAEPPPRTFQETGALELVGVGALNESQKGFTTAIRAAAALRGARLRLFGQRDGETPALEALGGELLGSRFEARTVPHDQIPAALAGGDVFVLPTHREGFCIAVLEAMSAGLPCLVSDIPVLRWLVGDAAILLPDGQPERWAAELAGLTAARRRDLSERARQRAASFRWDRLSSSYSEMYERALQALAA
jgi:glycosyltransferase involved in cell wall biosynthesis